MAIPSQAPMGRPRVAVLDGEGVETRRAAPTLQRGLPARPEHGEGIVQTTNPPAWGEAAKAVAGKKIRRAAMPVGVRVPPPAPIHLKGSAKSLRLRRTRCLRPLWQGRCTST